MSDREVDHTAMWRFWQHSFDPDNDQCWDRLQYDLKDGYRSMARALLNSGALEMPKIMATVHAGVPPSRYQVRVADYDRIAAAQDKIKGGK